MLRTLLQPFLAAAILLAATAAAPAQGVELRDDACVLFGAAAKCTKPATIDWDRVRDATPEWKTIKTDGVAKGSARYSLLISEMKQRIKKHCRKVAQDNGNDCVVRDGDITDARGLTVGDVTNSVIKLLESGDDDS